MVRHSGVTLAVTALVYALASPCHSRAQNVSQRQLDEAIQIHTVIARVVGDHPDIEEALVWGIAWTESRYNTTAENDNGGGRGIDRGLMQLNFWQRHCVPPLSDQEARVLDKNVRCGVQALSRLKTQYSNRRYAGANVWHLVVADYNAGHNAVQRCYDDPRTDGCARERGWRGVPDNARSSGGRSDTLRYVKKVIDMWDFGRRVDAYARQLAVKGTRGNDPALQRLAQDLQRELAHRDEEVSALRNQVATLQTDLNKTVMERDVLMRQIREQSSPTSEEDRLKIAALVGQIAGLHKKIEALEANETLSRVETANVQRVADSETGKVRELEALLRAKDAHIAEVEVNAKSWRDRAEKATAEIVRLQRASASRALDDQQRGDLARLEEENRSLTMQVENFVSRLDQRDTYARGIIEQLQKRLSSQQIDLADLAKHAVTVINPPPLPGGALLCTAGFSMANIDREVLTTGTILVSDFVDNSVDKRDLSLPNVYSYTYREFRYSIRPTTPIVGTYIGSLASGDAVQFTVEAGPQLRSFETTLNLRAQRRKLQIAALNEQNQGCDFRGGLVAAFLPYSTGQIFLIVRANTPYEAVGYVLIRAIPTDPVVLLQFRASRIGR